MFSEMVFKGIRTKLGAVIFDVPRFLANLLPFNWRKRDTPSWISIRNRRDSISFNERGARCNWIWTSDLHIATVFPSTGRWLMRRAFRDWPLGLTQSPPDTTEAPEVSFVICHRGRERLPHLQMALRSIAAQEDVSTECIVVEQSVVPEIRDELPGWVRYVHTPVPRPDLPFCRAWALNVGAREARGSVVILHDNDLIVPTRYAREVLDRIAEGADFAELKRFTFYLTTDHSQQIVQSGRIDFDQPPDAVVQNLQGASIAARREAFVQIGGFDESFIGWGGEDNDFWDRARTMRVNDFGYLPFLHLYHRPQPEKVGKNEAPAVAHYRTRSQISPAERIEQLCERDWGNPLRISVDT